MKSQRLQVCPGLSEKDTRDGRYGYLAALRDVPQQQSFRAPLPDIPDQGISEFCFGICFAFLSGRRGRRSMVPLHASGMKRRPGSPLPTHVLHVVNVSPDKKVSGLEAWRVVAVVTPKHAIRDRCPDQTQRHDMDGPRTTIDANDTVAVGIARSAPLQASIRHPNAPSPDTVNGLDEARTGTRQRAVFACSAFYFGQDGIKKRAATQAGTLNRGQVRLVTHRDSPRCHAPGCDNSAGATSCPNFTRYGAA